MTGTEIALAFAISAALIVGIIAFACRYHAAWENSAMRERLLWALVNHRARVAARPRRGSILRAVIDGTVYTTRSGDTDALIVLAFDRTQPYAVRLCASTSDIVYDDTFARTLLTEAIRNGRAGEGRVRVSRVGRTTLSITVEPTSPYGHPVVYRLPTGAVTVALARFERAVPTGTETVDIDAALTRILAETTQP